MLAFDLKIVLPDSIMGGIHPSKYCNASGVPRNLWLFSMWYQALAPSPAARAVPGMCSNSSHRCWCQASCMAACTHLHLSSESTCMFMHAHAQERRCSSTAQT